MVFGRIGEGLWVPEYLTVEEIKATLECGNLDQLVGAVEEKHPECKSAPYQLKHDHQKRVLAKRCLSW